jgi:hypothetical protein
MAELYAFIHYVSCLFTLVTSSKMCTNISSIRLKDLGSKSESPTFENRALTTAFVYIHRVVWVHRLAILSSNNRAIWG